MSIFDLDTLTPQQREITQSAIDAVDFDWGLLVPKLRATKGKDVIPVEWADLSKYNQAAETKLSGEHADVHEDDDTGEVIPAEIEGRAAALGLAWYSGKVSIDVSLINNEPLAKEVFLAEGAHMIDFFYMTDSQRDAIQKAYHDEPHEQNPHSDWFEEGGVTDYWSWVGESFMSGFIKAYAPTLAQPLEARQPWTHKTTPEIAAQIRETLTPSPADPEVPPPVPFREVFGLENSKVYHDSHKGVRSEVTWESTQGAQAEGRRACRTCKP
jgi:hypothetical protein